MNHAPRLALVLAVLLLASVVPATAHGSGGGWGVGVEVTPQISYRYGGEIDTEIDFEPIDFDNYDLDEGEAFGLLVGVPLGGDGLRLELFASRQDSDVVVRSGLFQPEEDVFGLEITFAQVGLAYQWDAGRVSPFAAVSLGAADLDPDFAGASSETRFAGTLGGGLKLHLAEHLALRFDLRAYYVHLDDGGNDDCSRRRRRDCYDEDGALTQGDVSLGLAFSW
jgi:hypothetical protein